MVSQHSTPAVLTTLQYEIDTLAFENLPADYEKPTEKKKFRTWSQFKDGSYVQGEIDERGFANGRAIKIFKTDGSVLIG